MQKRTTYEELEQRVKDLEKKAVERRWADEELKWELAVNAALAESKNK